jgi:hypothetical protein
MLKLISHSLSAGVWFGKLDEESGFHADSSLNGVVHDLIHSSSGEVRSVATLFPDSLNAVTARHRNHSCISDLHLLRC